MKPPRPSLTLPTELNLNPLSPQSAHLLSFLFTSGYVGSIYLSNVFSRTSVSPHKRDAPKTAHSDEPTSEPLLQPITSTEPLPPTPAYTGPTPQPGERDHPGTIKRRMKAVGLATALSAGGVWGLVCHLGGYRCGEGIIPTARLLGLPTSISFPSLALLPSHTLPYLLAPTLLLGPLYATWLDGDLPSLHWNERGFKVRWDRFDNDGWGLIGWRNYVVGPLTEEIVFRSSLLALALLSRAGMGSMVYTTPLYFGVAHAHHAWETYVKGGRNKGAAIRAIAGCAFQLTYTTLFGWYASYIYLRTGSIFPPLISHTYCNLMGIYMPQIAARRHPSRKKWIWGTYLAGVLGFIWGLRWV